MCVRESCIKGWKNLLILSYLFIPIQRFQAGGDRPSDKDAIAKYKDVDGEDSNEVAELPGITETCSQIVSICRLKPVQTLAFILLTFRIAFAPVDAVSNFKLQVA